VDQQPPQYALIGLTDVPLFAVSQQRSQRMKLDVYSPHTFSIVAELDISVICEPILTGEEHSFDIHLHSVQGFNDFIGSEFHVQTDLSNAGLHTSDRTIFVSKKRDLSTGSTLKYDQRFTFDSEEHISQLGFGKTKILRFEIFTKPKAMLLESLSSWDELRSQDDAAKFDETTANNFVVNGN
jgi:kinesin family member 1